MIPHSTSCRLSCVCPGPVTGSHTIEVFVGRLRKKLGGAELIETVRGQGYRMHDGGTGG